MKQISGPCEAVPPCYSVAYIDTIGVFLRYVPKGIRRILEPLHGRPLRIDESVDKYGRVWGYRVTLHQPKVCTLKALDRLQKKHGGKLCRVDVAYDFSSHSRDWLERRSTMRWRRRAPMLNENKGVYFIQQKGRRSWSGRDIVIYDDRPSKITGELDVNHFELRLQNTETVRRQGFEHAGDLIGLNPKELFDKHVKLVEVDIEAITSSVIRKTLKDERERHRSKGSQGTNPFIDRYRASLAHRLRSQLDRLIENRA
jgi:hypothetical protein